MMIYLVSRLHVGWFSQQTTVVDLFAGVLCSPPTPLLHALKLGVRVASPPPDGAGDHGLGPREGRHGGRATSCPPVSGLFVHGALMMVCCNVLLPMRVCR